MDLRECLQGIYDQHGQLTPDLVVAAARDKTHPLHQRVFDLGPKDAAEAWYRHRAHELIQSVRIVYRDDPEGGEPLRGRAFIAVRSEGPGQYVYEPAEKVAMDPLTRQIVLREMEREWRSLHRRYQEFEELTQMVAADIEVASA